MSNIDLVAAEEKMRRVIEDDVQFKFGSMVRDVVEEELSHLCLDGEVRDWVRARTRECINDTIPQIDQLEPPVVEKAVMANQPRTSNDTETSDLPRVYVDLAADLVQRVRAEADAYAVRVQTALFKDAIARAKKVSANEV